MPKEKPIKIFGYLYQKAFDVAHLIRDLFSKMIWKPNSNNQPPKALSSVTHLSAPIHPPREPTVNHNRPLSLEERKAGIKADLDDATKNLNAILTLIEEQRKISQQGMYVGIALLGCVAVTTLFLRIFYPETFK